MAHISSNKSLSLAGFPPSLQACKQFQVKVTCHMVTRTQQSEILIIAIGLASFATCSVVPASVETSLNTNIFLLFTSSEDNEREYSTFSVLCVKRAVIQGMLCSVDTTQHMVKVPISVL